MHADLLIVQVCKFLDDGDGAYRLHDPSRSMARVPGVVTIDCHFAHRHLPRLARLADVLILPHLHNWDLLAMIDLRRAAGKVTVFEANDNFDDVQPWSPVASIWRQQSIRAEYRKYMSHCDAVQTSTSTLANLWKPLARRVQAFPNQLASIPPLPDRPQRPLVIGWGGSAGHLADWYALAPHLQRWLDARTDVHLAVMTTELAKSFFNLPPRRYHFTPFSSLGDYMNFLTSLDIGLAPLLPTDYNRGRSDVKFLEYASRGVMGIYENLDPYQDSVTDGNTGFLACGAREMLQQLDRLADDPELRDRIRRQAYEHVSRERCLDQHIARRLEFYRGLLPVPPAGVDLPDEILHAAHAEDCYLCLRPGEPEEVFLSAQADLPPPQAIDTLAKVCGRFPDYHLALRLRGRLLNDAKRFTEALDVLKRARELEPSSASVLCELGRAHHLSNRPDIARQCMEEALAINPSHYPGWQYFLRFLRVIRAADGASWAARAREAFPDDFALALLAIPFYPALAQIQMLRELLECPAANLYPEQTAAVLAFEQCAAEALIAVGDQNQAIQMLRRACEIFPRSARLADMLGHCLHGLGQNEAAMAQFRRALEIWRLARLYSAEYPQDEGSLFVWQFAEHVECHRTALVP